MGAPRNGQRDRAPMLLKIPCVIAGSGGRTLGGLAWISQGFGYRGDRAPCSAFAFTVILATSQRRENRRRLLARSALLGRRICIVEVQVELAQPRQGDCPPQCGAGDRTNSARSAKESPRSVGWIAV